MKPGPASSPSSSSSLSISIPPALKKIKVFLTHANELDRDRETPESRVLAYNCRKYAVHVGLNLAGNNSNNPSSNRIFLGKILDEIEKEKDTMAVFNNNEHWQICRGVADKVLNKASKEEEEMLLLYPDGSMTNKQTNKNIAKTYYAAATFFDILQQFYPKEDEEIYDETIVDQIAEEEKRRTYCKWRATEIVNAIKEGRTPIPPTGIGRYTQQQTEDEEEELVVPPSMQPSSVIVPPMNMQHLSPAPTPISLSNMHENDSRNKKGNDGNIDDDSSGGDVGGGGFELNLNGDATPVSLLHEKCFAEENSMEASSSSTRVSPWMVPTPIAPPPPPPHSSSIHRSSASGIASSDPSHAIPVVPISSSVNIARSSSIISPVGQSSSSMTTSTSSRKLSVTQRADAIELTTFALSALEHGDDELARERIEQVLGVWKKQR